MQHNFWYLFNYLYSFVHLPHFHYFSPIFGMIWYKYHYHDNFHILLFSHSINDDIVLWTVLHLLLYLFIFVQFSFRKWLILVQRNKGPSRVHGLPLGVAGRSDWPLLKALFLLFFSLSYILSSKKGFHLLMQNYISIPPSIIIKNIMISKIYPPFSLLSFSSMHFWGRTIGFWIFACDFWGVGGF